MTDPTSESEPSGGDPVIDVEPADAAAPSAYPLNFSAEYGDGTRNRGIAVLGIIFVLKQIAIIPHVVFLVFYGLAAIVGAWFGYWIVLFTGKMPEGLELFVTGYVRWAGRVGGWLLALDDGYPPFSFGEGLSYPVEFTTSFELENRNRGWAVLGVLLPLKVVALLPHLIILEFLQIIAFVVFWIGAWATLFTGKYPEGIYDFVLGSLRWGMRVSGMLLGLTDAYPPFRLRA